MRPNLILFVLVLVLVLVLVNQNFGASEGRARGRRRGRLEPTRKPYPPYQVFSIQNPQSQIRNRRTHPEPFNPEPLNPG